MDRRTAIISKVDEYKKLQPFFVSFCNAAMKALPAGNAFGIEFGDGDNVSLELAILNYKCRMRFDVRVDPAPMLGKITFERLLPREQTRHLFTMFFDRLGNATDTPDERSWPFSVKDCLDITNSISIRLLEEFFKDLAANVILSKVTE